MTQAPHTRPRGGPGQELVALLEQVLPVGYSLTHTRHAWYLKCWSSWLGREGARMGWQEVDSDYSLSTLLERIVDA